MNNRLSNFFRPRTNIEPSEVRLGHEIFCSDGRVREVDVLHHLGDGVYRFMFSDDTWIEYTPGQKTTVAR